ncbi:MAG: site-specific integrase [Nitrososphaerales archaeon]|nr:site-specific integrase [Nitrososphaerales archaeon]
MRPHSEEGQRSVEALMASMKLADATKAGHLMRVSQYAGHLKTTPDEVVREAKAHPRKFEETFREFVQAVGKNASPATTSSYRHSLKRFLEVNRVTSINWDYIGEFVPSARRAGQDRAPTLEEIRKIVDVADLRMRCLALFLCSSGARIGSVPYLRWRDVEEVESDGEKLAKVTIYRGEPEEYLTFITPECYRYLLQYRELREKIGEKVVGMSFVFTTQPNARKFDQSKVGVASVKTLKNQLGELLRHLGMRTVISERGGYKNYEFKQAHGFRKFFKTRMEMSGVKPIITEMLMGHAIGVSGSYMKPTEKELLEEYSKAVDNLTIIGRAGGRVDIKNAFREQLLIVAGFNEEEIGKMDLDKVSDEEFQQVIRRRLLGTMTNNGNHQKVIPLGEVDSYISKGWEFVAALPNDRAILKLPR